MARAQKHLLRILTFVMLLHVTPAWAGEDLGLPAPPLTSDTLRDDGSALLTNPANLSYRPGVSAGLGAHISSSVMQGDGGVLFANYTAPFRLSIGAGVAARFGDARGMTGFASLGWGAGPFAMALRYRVYQAAHHPLHGTSTSDFALSLRPTNFMSLSAVFTNLWTPKIDATDRLERGYRVESGWRMPNGRFGGALQYRADDIGLGYNHWLALHMEARVARGVHLFASGAMRVTSANDSAASASEDAQLSAGLSLQTGALGTELGVHGSGAQGEQNLLGASMLFQYRSKPRESATHRSGQLLKVSLSGRIKERPTRHFLSKSEQSLSDVLMLLRKAERSPQLDGVYLHLSGLKAGVGQLWELRQALDAIRQRGRHVVIYLEDGGLRDLYLAAAGDYIMTSPAFVSQDAGLKVERFYISDLLERLGIEATFVRVGEYKSAVETFTRSGPSQEADTALHAYMRDVWEIISHGLCENRPASACPKGSFPLNKAITADSLYSARWVQALGYEDELPERLGAHFKRRLEAVDPQDVYGDLHERWDPQPHMAVLHIDGSLVSDKSGTNILTGKPFTGASTIEAAAKAIREDRSVRGVIVRINSPGGSLFASDEIHRALTLLDRSGIPMVFSFGDAAASGGYYVSALGRPIYAAPTTVTGSIGIYTGTFSIEQLLQNVGVQREIESVGGPAQLYRGTAWSEEDRQWMQDAIQHGYDRFRKLVADGRDLSIDEVEAVAQGRIWSGKAAQKQGLVDHIGGFMDAYDALCTRVERCQREPYPLKHFGQVVSLKLPFALAGVLGVDSQGAGAEEIRTVLEQSGVGTVVEPLLTLAPARAREPRTDLGGIFRVTFD